jgi:hypothetical protein
MTNNPNGSEFSLYSYHPNYVVVVKFLNKYVEAILGLME